MAPLTRASAVAVQTGARGCESVQEIINVAATAEALSVTLLGGALDSAANGELVLDPEAVQALTAARAAEQAHYEFLLESGAEAQTLTFTLPDQAIVSDVKTFFDTLIELEEVGVAAYLAAAQEFAVLGEPALAQVALQIGAVESEHRAGARFFAINAGVLTGVPNDVAFEKARFASLAEAADALEELGFIGGDGPEIEYPGPGVIDPTGVGQLRP